MSENIENENEIMDEAVVAEETIEVADVATAEIEGEVAAEAEQVEDEAVAADAEEIEEEIPLDDQLFDKIQRAARLLRARKAAMAREAEEDAARVNDLLRALKLLELKPEMEQKEMSDLLGMRLRELDSLLRQAEEAGAVTRVMPEEEDMRAVLVSATENAEEYAAAMGNKRKKLVAQLSSIDAEDIIALMDKIIDPLTEMGLDNDDRGGRGGFGDRGGRGGFGGRGGDRGPRRDFGGRGGDRGPRRDDRGPRRDFGDRGPRKDFGDRGPRRDDRGPRRDFGERGGRGGFGGRDDRGGRGGYGDRGGRGNYGDRRGGSRY